MAIKVAIVGASGYTGIELIRLLLNHPEVEIKRLFAQKTANKKISEVYPHFCGLIDLEIELFDLEKLEEIDLVFLALPHGASFEILPGILNKNIKVIDLSADLRIKDPVIFKKYYQKELANLDLIAQAVPGFPEIYFEDIVKANLISNPGCYVTSVVLGLYPLIKLGYISRPILVDAKSGVSGAGRTLKEASLYCEVNESFSSYATFTHRHIPEMEAILKSQILFSPHLVPMNRGILSSIYLENEKNLELSDLRRIYLDYYQDKPFVKLYFDEERASTSYVSGSNYIAIFLKVFAEQNKIVIFSAVDNLIKGASGQAIQNMNIMFGFDEKMGLTAVPHYL